MKRTMERRRPVTRMMLGRMKKPRPMTSTPLTWLAEAASMEDKSFFIGLSRTPDFKAE